MAFGASGVLMIFLSDPEFISLSLFHDSETHSTAPRPSQVSGG
jgi:hypothetical protein